MSKLDKIPKIKLSHLGDEFAYDPKEKNLRLKRVEEAGKAGLFNRLSLRRTRDLINFQKDIYNIFVSNSFDIVKTKEALKNVSCPAAWKERAVQVLDEIEDAKKFLEKSEEVEALRKDIETNQPYFAGTKNQIEILDTSSWPINPANFGILPLTAEMKVGGHLGPWSGHFYYLFNKNYLHSQAAIREISKHELEHFFQYKLIDINQNENISTDQIISDLIAAETGAFLTSAGDREFDMWFDQFKIHFQRSTSFVGDYYQRLMRERDKTTIGQVKMEQKINKYLDAYYKEIKQKLADGFSIEDVIIWLRTNRLNLAEEKDDLRELSLADRIYDKILAFLLTEIRF